MAEKSKTILELDKLAKADPHDQIPVARVSRPHGDDKIELGDIISFDETNKTLTLYGTYVLDVSSLLDKKYTVSVVIKDERTDLGVVKIDDNGTTKTVKEGTPVTLKAIPNEERTPRVYFVQWLEDNIPSPTRQINVDSDKTYTAEFAEEVHIVVQIDGTSIGTGTVDVAAKRKNDLIDLQNEGIRIGDVVTLTATGVTNKPSAWKDGQGNAIEDGEVYALDTSADEKIMTCTFTYAEGMPLRYMAEFNGPKITKKYIIGIYSSDTTAGTAVIQQNNTTIAEEEAIEIEDGANIKLVASAKGGWKFAGWWKGGVKIEDKEAKETYPIIVSAETAGTYTAKFERSGAPDFYYGAMVPDGTSGNAYEKQDQIKELTPVYVDGSTFTTPNLAVGLGKKFILLYNASKVKPTSGQMLSGGLTTDYVESDFSNTRKFLLSTITLNNVQYNTFESKEPMKSSDVTYSITLTKQ
jgi:hypothetical protein